MILGNERMISSWPMRGAPVLYDGKIYFGAGIWPFMGTFLYALDAETGEVVWQNSGSASVWILQPHGSPSFAGVGPQGYTIATDDTILFSGGRSVPAAYDRDTGAFRYYYPGWNKAGNYKVFARDEWFLNEDTIFDIAGGQPFTRVRATVMSAAEMVGIHEGVIQAFPLRKPDEKQVTKKNKRGEEYQETQYSYPLTWQFMTDPKLDRLMLQAGSRVFGAGPDGQIAAVNVPTTGDKGTLSWQSKVDGEPFSMIAANGRLLVTTKDGAIHCFGATEAQARVIEATPTSTESPLSPSAELVLAQTKVTDGYALVLGLGTGQLAEGLVRGSNLRVIGVDSDANKVNALRRKLDDAGLYGERISLLTGDISTLDLPAYFADLIVSESLPGAGLTRATDPIADIFHSIRPYGGMACFTPAQAKRLKVEKRVDREDLPMAAVVVGTKVTVLRREGSLPGAGSWTHQNGDVANTVFSSDSAVKGPLGLLWFGGPSHADVLPRHGHGPPPQVLGGKVFLEGMNLLQARDVYTGRVLWKREFEELNTFGAYYDHTYRPDPYDRTYNQVHIPGANAIGTNYVVTEDAVYLAIGPDCLLLDPDTGETVSTFRLDPGDEPRNWGYIGVYGNYLIAGARPLGLSDEEVTRNDKFSVGSQDLVVLNRETGDIIWSREAAHNFRHNTIIAGAGKVFCVDGMSKPRLEHLKKRGIEVSAEPRILALDVATGDEIWSTTENVAGTWLGYSEEFDILLHGGSRAGDRARDEVGKGMAAYKGADGSSLWYDDRSYSGPPILRHDTIITQTGGGNTSAGPAHFYSLITGEPITREHPLTGADIPMNWIRFKGCNTAVASENLLTFRSASACFVDFTTGTGTTTIGGFKSGCTSNLIVADGVLNAPDYTRTCTCSYQNQSSLALAYDPDVEAWSFDYFLPTEEPAPISRLGINFGAPGNRAAESGTLFLEIPNVGGPSPNVPVRLLSGDPTWFRHHSSRVAGDMAWVGASGIKGTVTIAIRPFLQPEAAGQPVQAIERNAHTLDLPTDEPAGSFDAPRAYTVRLYFTETDGLSRGERVFNVSLQGETALENFDIAATAGGPGRTVVQEFAGIGIKDDLAISLTPVSGAEPVLSGVELLAELE